MYLQSYGLPNFKSISNKYEKIMNIITKTQDALSTTFVAILGIVFESNTKLLGWFYFKFFEPLGRVIKFL
jgi:hypothetical protein